jgi:hypothetical protein
MTPLQILAVAVRLFSVWLAVATGQDVIGFYVSGMAHGSSDGGLIAILSILFVAVIVVALWSFPRAVARKLISPSDQEPLVPASPDSWLAVGCTLIGVWLFASSLPALVRRLLVIHFSDGMVDSSPDKGVWMFYYLVQIAISLWLIFGAKGLKNLIRWARDAGKN